MKVKLATQVLSRSVADALDFCRDDLKLPEFQGSEATSFFLRQFDTLFDLMNSKNVLGKGYKSPLRHSNQQAWAQAFSSASSYIQSLKTAEGQRLIDSPRKSGFLGFLINIQSFQMLFEKFVENGPLKFLMTFKFSQDHIELFFCSLRSRFGSNNNPSAKEFQAAYKRLLLHQEIRGNSGNCILDDDTFLLPAQSLLPPQNAAQSLFTLKSKYCLTDCKTDHNYSILSHWPQLSEFQSAVLEYIAGFCVRNVLQQINCPECYSSVAQSSPTKLYKLVNQKDRGGLLHPNSSVLKVIEVTERVIKKLLLLTPGNVPFDKNVSLLVSSTVLDQVVNNFP